MCPTTEGVAGTLIFLQWGGCTTEVRESSLTFGAVDSVFGLQVEVLRLLLIDQLQYTAAFHHVHCLHEWEKQ